MNLQGPGLPGGASQDTKIIRGAIVASLVLHVVLAAATWRIPLKPDPSEFVRPDTSREVELILEEPADPVDTATDDQPTAFRSVPERQAQPEAPEDPDYLALYHSLAADNKMGDQKQPSADEEGDFESVEIQKEQLSGAGGVAFSQQPLPENQPATSQLQSGAEGADESEASGDQQDPLGEWALPEDETRSGGEAEGDQSDDETDENPELEDWWGGQSSPTILKEGEEAAIGDRGYEFDQKSQGSVTSGVAIDQQFQLNTVQWDFAPWIQVFANELHRHWVSPYAYRLGLINGTTVIRLVVEMDGRPSSMTILETDGHDSLHDASLAALKAFAPYAPLPPDFPEENLVITMSLHYPAFRR